jgi:hypothetical protein
MTRDIFERIDTLVYATDAKDRDQVLQQLQSWLEAYKNELHIPTPKFIRLDIPPNVAVTESSIQAAYITRDRVQHIKICIDQNGIIDIDDLEKLSQTFRVTSHNMKRWMSEFTKDNPENMRTYKMKYGDLQHNILISRQ